MTAILDIHDLALDYAGGFSLRVPHLAMQEGEVLALVGESGCGKTTLLRSIAGFEQPHAGKMQVSDQVVMDSTVWLSPEKRRVGMVFQDYALFPHMRVSANVGYGLRGLSKTEKSQRIAEALQLVGLEDYASRYPHELSGGQQQRVALARALAPKPSLLLLDEPFSNLDTSLKDQVRRDMKHILRDAGIAVVLVTHDADDALVMADRIAVMASGRFEQLGTAEELYRYPDNEAVARFFGKVCLVPGTISDGIFTSPFGEIAPVPERYANGPCHLMLRPGQARIGSDGWPARVSDCLFKGHGYELNVLLEAGDQRRELVFHSDAAVAEGSEVQVAIDPAGVHFIGG